MTSKLIAITGQAGSGKDTLADACVFQLGAVKYNFALPIKLALNAMFCWTMDMWDNRLWKERVIPWLGKSPRQLAQTLGTEWGRDLIHPELWTMIALERYAVHCKTSNAPFIIADMRFDNEARAVHRNGGTVVKVVRRDVAPISAHKSEKGVSEELIDQTVSNAGSLHHYVEHAVPRIESLLL